MDHTAEAPPQNSYIPAFKVYRPNAVPVATFFGGPLVAGYLMAANFNAFNEHRKALASWIISISVTIGLFVFLIAMPDTGHIPNEMIPLAYTLIAQALMKHYQKARIDTHIAAGGATYSNWRVVGVSLVSLVITVALVFGSLFVAGSFTRVSDSKTYPPDDVIEYNRSHVTESDADQFAGAFRTTGFFGTPEPGYAYLDKTGNTFHLSVLIREDITAAAVEATGREFRDTLQQLLPANPIIMHLCRKDIHNAFKTIE